MTQPLLQAADLRGAARLTTEAVAALASLVEAVHGRIERVPSLPRSGEVAPSDERTRGITGLVYERVRGVTHLVGNTAEALLSWLAPALARVDQGQAPLPEREAIVAALNGVLGDHLAATDNPLAITMAFRQDGRPLRLERLAMRTRVVAAKPRLVVLLHGLCMDDLQWRRSGHDHGVALAQESGYTAVYLHYNTGLSVSTNGRILAQMMERLYDAWPVPIERLAMVGHSMGGLVARSAIHHGILSLRGGLRWPGRVNDLVCLGTPHQGAPLERAGYGVDLLLGAAPFAAPLARLSKLRSAGINDLRMGHVVKPPTDHHPTSVPVGLPEPTRCYAVAGSLGSKTGKLTAKVPGDGLVPVCSALGQDADLSRQLAFPTDHQAVFFNTGHMDLLSSTEVCGRLRQWLN